jgi:hypothetical protein
MMKRNSMDDCLQVIENKTAIHDSIRNANNRDVSRAEKEPRLMSKPPQETWCVIKRG